jgi:hypothetical protein
MSHAPVIDLGHDQPPIPNEHFSSWLRGHTTLFITQIVAVLGFVSFIASMVYYIWHIREPLELLKPATVKLIVDYAHVIFMAVFVLVLIRVLDDNDRGHYRVKRVYGRVFGKYKGSYEHELRESKKQLKDFKRRFLLFWVGMLFLYVFFACEHSYQLATSPPEGEAVRSVSQPADKSHGVKEMDSEVGARPGSTDAASAQTAEPLRSNLARPNGQGRRKSPHNLPSRSSSSSLTTSRCCSSSGVS